MVILTQCNSPWASKHPSLGQIFQKALSSLQLCIRKIYIKIVLQNSNQYLVAIIKDNCLPFCTYTIYDLLTETKEANQRFFFKKKESPKGKERRETGYSWGCCERGDCRWCVPCGTHHRHLHRHRHRKHGFFSVDCGNPCAAGSCILPPDYTSSFTPPNLLPCAGFALCATESAIGCDRKRKKRKRERKVEEE